MVKQFDLAGGGIENWFAYVWHCCFCWYALRVCSGSTSTASEPCSTAKTANSNRATPPGQRLPIAQDRWFVIGLVVFACLIVPVLASDYMFRALIIPFVILAIAAIGLNILVGYCGQISIGTAAFMAVKTPALPTT